MRVTAMPDLSMCANSVNTIFRAQKWILPQTSGHLLLKDPSRFSRVKWFARLALSRHITPSLI